MFLGFYPIPHLLLLNKKKRAKVFAKFEFERYQAINGNGKRGIRTLGTNNSYTGLAIRRFNPLSHLS